MSKTHYKKFFNPNYFGSHNIEPGSDRILTIKKCVKELVMGEGGRKEDLLVCHWQEEELPLILNVTNCKIIHKLYRTPHVEEWIGKRVQLYVDNNVRFGSEVVSGVRVRPIIPKTGKEKLSETRFQKMLTSITSGKYTADKAIATFDLTADQLTAINEAQSEKV